MASVAFALPEGTKLNNRYIVSRVLGNGGFGITYEVTDTMSKYRFAVKELYPKDICVRMPGSQTIVPASDMYEKLFEHSKDRFLEEAQILLEFNKNPQIVSVFDFFLENGTCYFVMEYLDGKTLNAIRKERGGKLPWDYVSGVIKQAGEALMLVHSKGKFHRDIGPDNIFVVNSSELKVKLIDFGNAKSLTKKEGEKLSVYLKPGFAPPEQYMSNSNQGTFSDVYSLAATIYYLLTGEKLKDPFTMQTNGYRKLTNYGISQRVSDAVDKALRFKSNERTQSIKEFLFNLGLFGDTGTLSTLPTSNKPKPKKVPFAAVKINNRVVSNYMLKDNTIYSVGRNANIVADEIHVSKIHCEIFYNATSGEYYIVDHSTNGTYVNGYRLNKNGSIAVKPGTIVYLGGPVCQLELGVFYG